MTDLRTIAAKLQERRRLAGWKEPEPRPPEKTGLRSWMADDKRPATGALKNKG
jgi:hypothetical protein